MPWCPKCKTEYREGITHCADCKTELVSDYKEVLLQNATVMLVKVDAEHQVFTKKLHDFLEYSGIASAVANEGDMIGVYVAPEDFKKAKKCFKAFYSVESENVVQKAEEAAFLKGEDYMDYFGDDEEDNDSAGESEDTVQATCAAQAASCCAAQAEKRFVSAASRYEDYRSSGYTFVILGVLGVVFALLNFFDVVTLFGSTFSSTVLFLIFAIFLVLGIFSFAKAGSLKEDAEKEKKLTEEVKAWIKENITKDMISEVNAEGTYEDEPKTAELLYLDCLDQLVDKVLEAFPNLHDSIAEQLIEEFCSEAFE